MKLFMIAVSVLVLIFSSVAIGQSECELCCKCPCTCFDKEIEELKSGHKSFAHFLTVMLKKGNFLFVEHLLVKIMNNPALINDIESQIDLSRFGGGVQKSTMIYIKMISEYGEKVRW